MSAVEKEAIERVRQALAMRDAGYEATPALSDIAALLAAHDSKRSQNRILEWKIMCQRNHISRVERMFADGQLKDTK